MTAQGKKKGVSRGKDLVELLTWERKIIVVRYVFIQIRVDLSVRKAGKVQELYSESSFGNRTASQCTGQKAGKSESCRFGASPGGSSGTEGELSQAEEETGKCEFNAC